MAEIDRLDIVIATSVKDAKAQITQFQNELESMKKTLGSITSMNAFKNTGKSASNVVNSVRQQSQRMVREYSKAAKTMTTIRDKMVSKSFQVPNTVTGARQALADYQKMFATAKDKVLTAQARGENYGKVYRNQVENLYKAAEGIKAARQVINERVEQDLAFQRLLEEERAAREAAKSVEQLADAYEDVAKNATKIKYVNQSRLDQFKDAYDQGKARIGASPYFKTNQEEETPYRSLRDTLTSMADTLRNKAIEMRDAFGNAFDNMKAKVDAFKVSMREKAVENGILSYTEDFVTLQKSIEKTRAEYARLTDAMREYKAAGGSESDTTYRRYVAKANRLQENLDSSDSYARQMKQNGTAYEVNTKSAEQNLDRLAVAFVKVGNNAKHALKTIASFVYTLSGIKIAASLAQKGMSKLSGVAKKLVAELKRVTKMFKLMVTRMALRAVINNVGDGFKSLALHSEAFNESMSNLINSAKTLGYSIAGMVSPLINALAPALVYIINLITQAVNAINQLFSALTGGGTWNKAKNFTDSWADSIKGASGAAKDLKKTVLGFDELNQLQDNKSSGGGAGGLKDMFETVDIDPKWKEVAEWLKDMWGKKDFTELGTKLGEKLRDALESIPWDKIRKTSNDLGKALATLINGFVEVERLGYDIGSTIAQGINTVFEFINGFVHNLHWDSIGKFIADTFNGFFETIDWDLIKDTVYTGLEGIADSINAFIKNFHWDNLSNFISNAVNTIATGIYKFVKRVEWGELGRNLGDQLTKTIQKIDWKQIGKTIGALLQSAIDFCKNFLAQLNWKDVKKAIKNLLEGFFEEVNKEDLAKIISGILIYSIGKAVVITLASHAIKNLGARIIGSLFGSSTMTTATTAATTAGTTIGTTLIGSIVAVFAGAEVGKLSWKWLYPDELDELKEKYSGLSGTIRLFKDFAEAAFYEVGEAAKTFADRTKEHLMNFATNIAENSQKSKESVTTCLDNIKEATKTFAERTAEHYLEWKQSAETSFGNVADAAKTFVDRTNEHWNNAANKVASFSDKVSEKVGSIKDKLNDLKESGGQRLQAFASFCSQYTDNVMFALENLLKSVDWNKIGIVKAFGELKDEATEKLTAVKEKIGEFKEDLATKFTDAKSKLEEFKSNVATKLAEVKEEFGTLKDKIAEAFSKDKWTFSGVSEGLKETFSKAKDAIKDAWNGIAEKVNGEHEVGSSKIKINLPKLYATGGFPEDGLFMANHNELVGKFTNGKTAVANNEQIVSGIERGVYNAVSSALSQQSGGQEYISNTIMIDGDVIARSITKAQEKTNRRYSPQTV